VRYVTQILLLLFISLKLSAQDYKKLISYSHQISSLQIVSEDYKKADANKLWNKLQSNNNIPLVENDSVYFFYRGEASSVDWMGDFNGWGFKKEFNNKGTRIAGTDIWILKASFPIDARLDYKILVDGNKWILDPENKFQQWSGVGGGSPNSELRMPEWKEDPILQERKTSQKGSIERDILFLSKVLGYQISYSVYLPFNYKSSEKFPVLYVTDGYEYLHHQLGNMSVVLDNLIGDKTIKPIIVIFIDHREPINRANNRRMQELGMNPKYLEFFVDELIPHIESIYPITSSPDNRAIMGASMGGLAATYFLFARPDIFGLAGVQSPSFYVKPQIYNLCANPADPKLKISMTAGIINDTSQDSRKMVDILAANTCVYNYKEVNEGHSWGNWKRLTDNILIDLFGTQ
jgi:enterochelin esterase-like enzyme